VSHEGLDLMCPLCLMAEGKTFYKGRRRDYFRCPVCYLVYVLPHQFLTQIEEKTEYDRHENALYDPHYRDFLSRIFDPLSQRLVPNSSGLDFGSGPEPALAMMFEEAGHCMQTYDIFYAPEKNRLQAYYDFITASEVVEHLHHPQQELDRLWSCLKPNGLLAIMTKRVIDQQAFSRWHYKNDPTHVCFYSIETFQWLADFWGATMTIVGKDVVIFDKR